VDLENGTYSTKNISPLNVKFSHEARMCFGFTVMLEVNGDTVEKKGVRCALFDYTKRMVVTIKRYNEAIKSMIDHVRSLPSGGGWISTIENSRNILFADDHVDAPTMLELGDVTKTKFFMPNGIKTIRSLIDLQLTEVPVFVALYNGRGVTVEKVTRWKQMASEKCQRDINGFLMDRPKKVDYRKAENPFLARYGDNWEEEIKNYKIMANFCCIKELVWYMVNECIRFNKKYFWHDALTQLTDKCTRQWMKETTTDFRGGTRCLYNFWFKPIKNLFHDLEKVGSHYYERQPGNFPTANCCDNKLNKHVHESVDCHVLLTFDLPKDHPNKFSRATPEKLARAYHVLMDTDTGVVPTPDNIIKDFEKVFTTSLPYSVRTGGLVDSGNQHRGVRYQRRDTCDPNWGGSRKRLLGYKDYRTMLVHKTALEGIKVKLEKSTGETFGDIPEFTPPEEDIIDLFDPVDQDMEETLEVIEVDDDN